MRQYFTEEENAWLISFIPGHTEQEIGAAFEEKFGRWLNSSQIGNKKHKLGVFSGTTGGQFKKGHSTWNKGTHFKAGGRSTETQFKPGIIPPNHRAVGSERITRDGYREIKVAEPNKWKLKHRLIYEEYHGEIPKKDIVIFLDGNKENFEINNLISVSRAELARINKQKVMEYPEELRRTKILQIKLEQKLSD